MRFPLDRNIVITNPFGAKTKWYAFHDGVDLRANTNSVIAPESGIITQTYWSDLAGNVLMLSGNTGIHYFMHLSGITAGGNVREGQQIAVSGNTGKWTTSPHLHWGLKINNKYVDPTKYIGRQEGAELNAQEKREIADRFNSLDNSLKILIEKIDTLYKQQGDRNNSIDRALQAILKK